MDFKKKIENYYLEKKINSFFFKRLSSLDSLMATHGDQLLSDAILYSKMGLSSEENLKKMALIRPCVADISGQDSFECLAYLYDNIEKINSNNDAYMFILKHAVGKSSMKKFAYPNFSDKGIKEEYDINKWVGAVHNIYNSVQSNHMSLNNAVDYYSNSLDINNNEDVNFRRWFKYYSSGESKKYSKKKEEGLMNKKSVYMNGLLGHSNYQHDKGNNMPGDSFSDPAKDFEKAKREAKEAVAKREEWHSWIARINSAIRRIDKLIRDRRKCSAQQYRPLGQSLFDLSVQVSELQPITAYDLTYRTANKFEKLGFDNEARILKRAADYGSDIIKTAQEIPPQPVTEEAPAQQPPEQEAVPPGAATEEAPQQEEEGSNRPVPGPDEVEPAKLEDITPIPGPEESDYEKLAGNIDLADASQKLDQAAGMLADRRVIRLLAEFDIMLDKLGIASMFPELAESQAKLIDAFGYALTRVTKMMGQLSNAETLISNQQGNIPGVSQDPDGPRQEEGEDSPEEQPVQPVQPVQPEV